jgi:hypothetical protein
MADYRELSLPVLIDDNSMVYTILRVSKFVIRLEPAIRAVSEMHNYKVTT